MESLEAIKQRVLSEARERRNETGLSFINEKDFVELVKNTCVAPKEDFEYLTIDKEYKIKAFYKNSGKVIFLDKEKAKKKIIEFEIIKGELRHQLNKDNEVKQKLYNMCSINVPFEIPNSWRGIKFSAQLYR